MDEDDRMIDPDYDEADIEMEAVYRDTRVNRRVNSAIVSALAIASVANIEAEQRGWR